MTDETGGFGRLVDLTRSRPFVYAALFCLGLIVFELLLFPRDEQFILARHLEQGNYTRLFLNLLLSGASTVLTFIFVWLALTSFIAVRLLAFVLFSIAILIEYGCYKAFGRFSVQDDIALAIFAGDWRFTAAAAAMYFNYLALVPIAFFAGLLLLTKTVIRRALPLIALTALVIAAFFGLTSYFTKNLFYTVSFASAARSLISFPSTWYLGSVNGVPERLLYLAPRKRIDFHAASTPSNNIVFIVDESVRGDHLSLNGYAKPTSPYLDDLARKGFVKNWGIAAAGTTCSVTSNSLLLTGANKLPDRDLDVHQLPTIFGFARAMNYRTYYFDAQVSESWNGKPSDIADYGEWVKADDLAATVAKPYDIDAEIARRIKKITGTSTGNFIWVTKFGVHKPYTASYPNDKSENIDSWFRQYDSNIDARTLVHEYDQAITYNLESFFSNLLDGGRGGENTVYVYTSDHGQSLMENGATVSHCSNTRGEAMVPLLMIAHPARLAGIDDTYRASHANIFSTLLDLMSVPDGERPYPYALSLLKAKSSDSAPRSYYAGNLQGTGDGKKYPFD